MEALLFAIRYAIVYVLPAAAGFIVLFYVIRGAVLSALRRHESDARGRSSARALTDLDGPGI